MFKDSLALSAVSVGPPDEAEYEALYAAVTATDRGRWFLTEFANRSRNADTETVVAALARIEAAVHGGGEPSPSAVATWRDLNGIAAAIGQVRAVVAGDSASDSAVAIERIHDIAFSLRERGAALELCNALDTSLREISTAAIIGKVSRAAELLDNLAVQVGVLIKRSLTGASSDHAAQALSDELSVAATAIANDDRRAALIADFGTNNKTPQPVADLAVSLADAVFAIGPQNETPAPLTPPVEEPQPVPLLNDGPRWHIEAPDFFFQSPAASEKLEAAEAVADTSAPHALLPPVQLQTEPEDDPADLFEPALPIAEPAAAAPPQANGSPRSTVIYPSPGATLRKAPSDSFAALRGLSEDELNALFG
ncbi:MAG TPA: hypothetical protein VH206_01040 [Xanthobacteraceae bacterium]|jgi:hypothetical protein|nr:hypothetical protein [Xanthobacteraceae bacterium]